MGWSFSWKVQRDRIFFFFSFEALSWDHCGWVHGGLFGDEKKMERGTRRGSGGGKWERVEPRRREGKWRGKDTGLPCCHKAVEGSTSTPWILKVRGQKVALHSQALGDRGQSLWLQEDKAVAGWGPAPGSLATDLREVPVPPLYAPKWRQHSSKNLGYRGKEDSTPFYNSLQIKTIFLFLMEEVVSWLHL